MADPKNEGKEPKVEEITEEKLDGVVGGRGEEIKRREDKPAASGGIEGSDIGSGGVTSS